MSESIISAVSQHGVSSGSVRGADYAIALGRWWDLFKDVSGKPTFLLSDPEHLKKQLAADLGGTSPRFLSS